MSDSVQTTTKKRTITPVSSIYGDSSNVVLRLEMPGVQKDDIDIRIDGDQLTISGRVPEETATGTWILRERRLGDYERSFTIDSTVEIGRASCRERV